MSVFSTSRPASSQEIMEEMARTQSERQINMELLKSQQVLEATEAKKQAELLAQDKKQKEDEEKALALENMRQQHRINQSKRAVTEAIAFMPKIARQSIIKRAILDVVTESLWVDDEVKNSEAVQKEASSVFDELVKKCSAATGEDLFSNMKNSKWLSCVDDIATECGKAVSDRIIAEASEAGEIEINFSLNNEEADEIDKKIVSLGSKEISDVIKKKVLNVIKDEKESGKVKAELFKELDEAGKDDNEPETGDGGVVESLIGQTLEATLEAVLTNIDKTFESAVDGVRILTKTADREVVAKNFDKAIGCYGKSKSLLCDILARSNAQEQEKIDYAIHNISSTMNDRLFQIAPGTRKVTRREDMTKNNLVDISLDKLVDAAMKYCDGVSDGCKSGKIVTETMSELQQRLVRESANRYLTSSIGSTMFESLMMTNSFKIENQATTVVESGTNVSMLESEKQNAALLQTILEYTVLETLNTLKVFKFDRDVVSNIKSM